jgi:hypothetical protein
MSVIPLGGTWILDDGGDGTDGLTWTTAYASYAALIAAKTLNSGDVIIVGHNHSESAAGNLIWSAFPAGVNTAPCHMVSCTQGTGSISGGGFVYNPATAAQFTRTTGGDQDLDGNVATYGLYFAVDRDWVASPGSGAQQRHVDLTVTVGNSDEIICEDTSGSCYFENLKIDDSNSSGSVASQLMTLYGDVEINGLSFTNVTARNAGLLQIGTNTNYVFLSGGDFTGFTHGTAPEIIKVVSASGKVHMENCHNPQGLEVVLDGTYYGAEITVTDVGSANSPTFIHHHIHQGSSTSSTVVTRTGGPTYEGTGVSWLIETDSHVEIGSPFSTPWIYSNIATGSQTVDLFITHDTQASSDVGDFTDSQVWMEAEYKANTTSGLWVNLAAASLDSVLSDDTTSTWSGAGPSYTYKQRLRITINPSTEGLMRARLVCAVPSMVDTDDFYVAPGLVIT